MKTLEQAFAERQNILAAAEGIARAVLDDFCRRRGFLLAGRAKTMDSLRDKIETGRYDSLDSVDDAIAFSVVIDTLSQEDDVRKFLAKSFEIAAMKSSTTLQDERSFDFDCTRVYCRISDNLAVDTPINKVIIEVQIRTILQHAWSKITHAQVYKANVFDAKAGRFAAEIMAQLESIDRSLSRFKTNSRQVKEVKRREMTASSGFTNLIDQLVATGVIPSEMRPENGRRLGENIYSAIRRDARGAASHNIDVVRSFMEAQRGKFPLSVSIFQIAVVALHEAKLLERGTPSRPRRYYVTDELISLFPSAGSIPNRVVIE